MFKNVLMKSLAVLTAIPVALTIPSVTVFAIDGQETPVEPEADGHIEVSGTGDYSYDQNLEYTKDEPGDDDYAATVTGSRTSPFTGFADADNTDLTLTIEGGVSASLGGEEQDVSVAYVNDGTININGNVVSDGGGIVAVGGDANVDGNITIKNDDTAIRSTDNSIVTVNGDVIKEGTGVCAVQQGGGITEIAGNVVAAESRGVLVNEGGVVNVGGSICANDSALNVLEGSSVIVGEDVISLSGKYEPAVAASSDSTIIIGGDIDANYRPLWITIKDASSGLIDVNGSINGSTGIQLRQYLYGYWDELTEEQTQHLIELLPTVNVYGISAQMDYNLNSETVSPAVYEAFLKKINYYIKAGENVTINNENKQTMRTVDTLNVTIPENYTLQVSDTMSFTRLEDGTYAVKLNSNKGNIDIKAVLRAISDATGIPQEEISVVSYNDESSNNTPAATNQGIITVVGSPASNPAAFAPVVEGAATPSKVVRFESVHVNSEEYKAAVIDSIRSTPTGTTLRIEHSTTSVFDKKMFEALAANPTIDVEVVFTHGGKKMRVVIPAGYDLNSLLDSNGYCGYLRLASILGSQTIES